MGTLPSVTHSYQDDSSPKEEKKSMEEIQEGFMDQAHQSLMLAHITSPHTHLEIMKCSSYRKGKRGQKSSLRLFMDECQVPKYSLKYTGYSKNSF